MATEKKYVSLSKLGLYDEKIKGVIEAGDAAALQAAKDYADGLATNYDAAGSAAGALAEAKTYADGKDAAIAEAKKAGTDAAAAAGVADGKAVAAQSAADAAQGDVDKLETYVGTIPETAEATDIVGYIQEKTSGIASEGAMTELAGKVAQAEKDIDAIEADYLKKADKEALQANIDAEATTARAAEKANADAIKAIQDDYLKAADKEELQGNIDTVSGAVERLTNGVSAEEIDGVNDLIQYVKDHGTEVTGMQEDISENAGAIAGVAGRVDTLEGEMEEVQDAVATKAEQSALDEAVEALEDADADQIERIAALEGKFGGADGSVEDLIEEAKQAAIAAAGTAADTKDEAVLAAAKKYADDEDATIEASVSALEAAMAAKAAAADLEAVAGRMTTAEGKITTLEGKMTAVEGVAADAAAAAAANAAEIAKKAAQSDLEAAVARIAKNEEEIASFVECSQEDINALFA